MKAQQAWESDAKSGGYTGDGVVVGIMEEVNHFHALFGSGDNSKIHPASVLTSLYPEDLPAPPEKYITGQFTKHPEFTCLLQFEGVDDCPDTSGNQKYFLRDENGDIQVLPGLIDLHPKIHECPEFDYGEEKKERCSYFGTVHGTAVAGIAAANKGTVTINISEKNREGVFQDVPVRANYQGVAYDARILVYARPLEIAGLPASYQAHADYFRNAPKEADVYNFSHAFTASFDEDDDGIPSFPEGRESGFTIVADAIGGMSQPVIIASGNDYKKVPSSPAILPYFFPKVRGKILAVTAIGDDGRHALFANKCGPLPDDWNPQEHGRHYCLAAPGEDDFFDDAGFRLIGAGNEDSNRGEGTSFAAPIVAGSFAILKERFRNKDGTDGMSNKELIVRLVNTAYNKDCKRYYGKNAPVRDSSCDELLPEKGLAGLRAGSPLSPDYSDMSIYGAGLLDIEAAIMPVGTQRMSAFGDVNGGITYEFDVTSLTTSAAFGDALQRAFHTYEVAAFDELDAPFWYPLSSLTSTTSSRETLQERRTDLFEQDIAPVVETAIGGKLALTSTHAGSSGQIDMSLRQPVDILVPQAELLLTAGDLSTSPFGLHEDKSFAHPYLRFADEGIGLGGAVQLGKGQFTAMGFTSSSANVARDIPIDAHGGILQYALEPLTGIEFGMQAGAMVEESRALGLLSEGGFGELGESSTAFAGVSLDSALEDSWRFRASMLFGRTNIDEPSIGLLKTSTTLASSAFRFAVEGRDVFLDADRMDVFVAQPLRIENGKADFTVPVGRTPAGLVRREQINGVSLEPGGRELEFGMRYEMQVSEDITATGGLGIVHEGGHSKHTETEIYGLANLRFQF
ncbi:MAG: S8 family serine peptidase [Hyphomicrobiales bacterium]|nr:S8 family serine peptidase [Hyphomicrobiales bacterium]